MMAHQEVVLVRHRADKRQVNGAPAQLADRALQGQVELANPGIGDEVRALDTEIHRDVKDRHIWKTSEGQPRVHLLYPLR